MRHGPPSPGLQAVADRLLFQQACNLQVLLACAEARFTASERLGRRLQSLFSRVGSTQIIEDTINHQKNSGVLQQRK